MNRGQVDAQAAELLALAHAALLDDAAHDDPQRALQAVLEQLAGCLQRACRVCAAHDALPAGFTPIALQWQGAALGTLLIAGAVPTGLLHALEPVQRSVAALLHRQTRPARPVTADVLRSALRSAGIFVWEWNLDAGRLTGAEDGMRALGYPSGGQTREEWAALIHPEDRQTNRAAFHRHARGEAETCEQVYRIRAADGGWRWYQSRGRIVERHADGRPQRMVGTLTDISEQRRDAGAAARAAAQLERISANVPGVLYRFELDADNVPRFDYLSDKVRSLIGLAPDTVKADARAFLDLIDPTQHDAFMASIFESARTLSPWRWEFRIQPENGTPRWVLGTSSPMKRADGGTVWHGYLQDITDTRELERARRDKLAAEASSRAKSQFLSRMSHELRTPLNAVLGFSQLLEMDRVDPLSEGQRRRVKLIRDAGDHLLTMIGDLLDLTRIESGSLQLELDGVPLRALAEEAIDMLQPQAAAAQVQVQLHEQDAPLSARADRTRLRQVLLNLLSNAIKYNRAGGQVKLALARTGDDPPGVSLCVEDTGPGIASTDLPHLFEPYNRLAQAGSGIEGIGIGLNLSRALVTLMRGEISVTSQPGAGSRFCVTLPRA